MIGKINNTLVWGQSATIQSAWEHELYSARIMMELHTVSDERL